MVLKKKYIYIFFFKDHCNYQGHTHTQTNTHCPDVPEKKVAQSLPTFETKQKAHGLQLPPISNNNSRHRRRARGTEEKGKER